MPTCVKYTTKLDNFVISNKNTAPNEKVLNIKTQSSTHKQLMKAKR